MIDKKSDIDMVEKIQLAMMKSTGESRRGQHFKQHACLAATFSILEVIPEELKVGLFASPTTFNAWVRFSNGGKMDDRKPDIHGIAIKLLDVPGDKILEGHEHDTTHDFILADNPRFFIRTAAEYVPFIEDFAQSSAQGKPPEKFIAWLKENRPEDLPVFLGFSQQIMQSPLLSTFWSQVPYASGLRGNSICRYSIKPHPKNPENSIAQDDRGADYLREALVAALTENQHTAVFDFNIQQLHDVSYETVNNPTILWDTPEITVARLTIGPQLFDNAEQRLFGETLSFTPWHCLPQHKPLGEMNEIRKQVYLASSALRHKTNGALECEPETAESKPTEPKPTTSR